jgi:predicted nucleic acid-binding protein
LKVLVDTNIWSLALRRRPDRLSTREREHVAELAALCREGRASIIGAVRQELLSGVREPTGFEHLRKLLRDFEDDRLSTDDYEEAARYANTCRRAGLASSPIDVLICAVSSRRDFEIFTTDPDFERYAKHLPIRLHEPRDRG